MVDDVTTINIIPVDELLQILLSKRTVDINSNQRIVDSIKSVLTSIGIDYSTLSFPEAEAIVKGGYRQYPKCI